MSISHGPFSGECGVDDASVVIWARATAPGGEFGFSIKNSLGGQVRWKLVVAKKEHDYTMKAKFSGLAPNEEHTATVAGRSCTFKTAATEDQSFSFVFGSCLGGQGYGRTTEGWKIFDEARKYSPNFFLFTGDTIYADATIPEVAKLMDGTTRNNLPHDVICKTIDQFRNRYKYQFEDPSYARFLSQTPTYVMWDDHEIFDDWGGAQMLDKDPELLNVGMKSFFEYWPVLGAYEDSVMELKLYRNFKYGKAEFFILDTRSYRCKHKLHRNSTTPTLENILGKLQCNWLISSLHNSSNGFWKIIVSSVPLSYPTGWPTPEVDGYDGWTADRELFYLFQRIRDTGVKNILFITGDVHFPYLISYDPFTMGTPFCYEAGATPFSAIPLPPSTPDDTLNPTVIWSEGAFVKGPMNFGHVQVNTDGSLKIKFIRDDGHVMFEKVLHAKREGLAWKKMIHACRNEINANATFGMILAVAVCIFFKVFYSLSPRDPAIELSSLDE